MTDFRPGVVITTCRGREQNLARVLQHLDDAEIRYIDSNGNRIEGLVVVFDGCTEPEFPAFRESLVSPRHPVEIAKHAPGQEQPRNVGARWLREIAPRATHVWFLDSDLIFQDGILDAFRSAHLLVDLDRILIGPYEWLAPEQYDTPLNMHNDCRWVSFNEHGPDAVLTNDLGAGLACFSGNLVWPLGLFESVGGFHPELNHGRCEDGELGLRAASAGIPMSFVRQARAWHVAHSVDGAAAARMNARDVPLLNSFHPWVEGQGLLVTEKDGARFDFRCPRPGCGVTVNSHDYWEHYGSHLGHIPEYDDPASVTHCMTR